MPPPLCSHSHRTDGFATNRQRRSILIDGSSTLSDPFFSPTSGPSSPSTLRTRADTVVIVFYSTWVRNLVLLRFTNCGKRQSFPTQSLLCDELSIVH